MGGAGARALAEALGHTPLLAHLGLVWAGVGPEGARALAGGLSSIPRLTSLQVGECLVLMCGSAKAAWHDSSVALPPQLTGNPLGPTGAAALASGLRAVPLLVELRLFGAGLGPEGGAALADSLRRLPRLALLDLGDNGLAAPGIHALSAVLPSLQSLALLDLDGNGVDGLTAEPLCEALGCCPRLVEVRLSYNELGEAGAAALAGLALPALHALERLYLSHNGLGPGGGGRERRRVARCLYYAS